jgi:hypothetical protein
VNFASLFGAEFTHERSSFLNLYDDKLTEAIEERSNALFIELNS